MKTDKTRSRSFTTRSATTDMVEIMDHMAADMDMLKLKRKSLNHTMMLTHITSRTKSKHLSMHSMHSLNRKVKNGKSLSKRHKTTSKHTRTHRENPLTTLLQQNLILGKLCPNKQQTTSTNKSKPKSGKWSQSLQLRHKLLIRPFAIFQQISSTDFGNN